MLRVEIELVPDFPHAKTVLITFLEKPIVDFRSVCVSSFSAFVSETHVAPPSGPHTYPHACATRSLHSIQYMHTP